MNTLTASIPAAPPAKFRPDRTVRILALPDLHIPFGLRQKQMLLGNRHFLDSHDWVVLLGDMTAAYGTFQEYQHVNRFIGELRRAYSAVNGNHEFSFTPCDERTAEYGRKWEHATTDVQDRQLKTFETFYGIPSRFQAYRRGPWGILLLGVDRIADDSAAELLPDHQGWLERTLEEMADLSLIVFCHFPAPDHRLEQIRYYEPGRRPYLDLPDAISKRFLSRDLPTYWFSGHVHFAPSHELAKPYLTDHGICQVHCPDGWGFGRRDNQQWKPAHHDDFFVNSVVVEGDRLSVVTTDLFHGVSTTLHLPTAADVTTSLGSAEITG